MDFSDNTTIFGNSFSNYDWCAFSIRDYYQRIPKNLVISTFSKIHCCYTQVFKLVDQKEGENMFTYRLQNFLSKNTIGFDRYRSYSCQTIMCIS